MATHGIDLDALLKEHPTVHVLNLSKQMKAVMTIIRNRETCREDFIFHADRMVRFLVEEGLAHLPYNPRTVTTPTDAEYQGLEFASKICGVSIVRAGESMEKALQQNCRKVRIGKILIQRDEETAMPHLFYTKLPSDIAERKVLLLDPMLATGGSAMKAIEVLIDHGVPEESIFFLNLIGCPEGIKNLTEKYPKVTMVIAEVDSHLNEKAYIIPGIGDFGDRYFGTDL